MASAILSIEGGGQPPVEENPAVIFADYDGTVIDTWTWDNKGSKTELPTVPVHEGLVFEGWNWTLEDIKNDTTGQIITVGPYYHTESGLTEIDVEVNITVTDSSLFPASKQDAIDQIKQNIITYAQYNLQATEGFAPGVDVIRTRLYTPVNEVPGFKVNSLKIGKHGQGAAAENDINIAWNQVATFKEANIKVEVV